MAWQQQARQAAKHEPQEATLEGEVGGGWVAATATVAAAWAGGCRQAGHDLTMRPGTGTGGGTPTGHAGWKKLHSQLQQAAAGGAAQTLGEGAAVVGAAAGEGAVVEAAGGAAGGRVARAATVAGVAAGGRVAMAALVAEAAARGEVAVAAVEGWPAGQRRDLQPASEEWPHPRVQQLQAQPSSDCWRAGLYSCIKAK